MGRHEFWGTLLNPRQHLHLSPRVGCWFPAPPQHHHGHCKAALGLREGLTLARHFVKFIPLGPSKSWAGVLMCVCPRTGESWGCRRLPSQKSTRHPGVPTALLLPVAGCLVVALGPAQTLDASVPWSPVLPHLGSSVASKMWETGVLVLKN